MQINRTCTIELSRDEVAEALTEYILRHKGYSSKLESWEEVLEWSAPSEGITLLWGEKPEPAPEPMPLVDIPPVAVDTSKDDVPF